MKRLVMFLTGLVAALSIGAYAVTGGGFPSRPTLQALTVLGGPGMQFRAGNTGASGRSADIVTNGTGGTSVGYAGIVDQSGTRFGYWGKASSSNGTIDYESDAGIQLVGNGGADKLAIDTSHNMTWSGTGTVPWVTNTSGTFTATMVSGCASGGGGTVSYTKTGNVVTWRIPSGGLVCTSNATGGVTWSGVPAAIQPPSGQVTFAMTSGVDNSTSQAVNVSVCDSGSVNCTAGRFISQPINSAGTASGTHGLNAYVLTYQLN
jgi:hypothetical protein